jgi:hypothetical protein
VIGAVPVEVGLWEFLSRLRLGQTFGISRSGQQQAQRDYRYKTP